MTFSVIYSHAHCEERRFVDFVVAVVRRSHVKLAPVRPAHNDPPRSSHKKDYHKTTPAYIDSKIVEYKTYHDNEVSCWLQQKRRLYEATVFLRLYDRCVKIFRSFDCVDKDTHIVKAPCILIGS